MIKLIMYISIMTNTQHSIETIDVSGIQHKDHVSCLIEKQGYKEQHTYHKNEYVKVEFKCIKQMHQTKGLTV